MIYKNVGVDKSQVARVAVIQINVVDLQGQLGNCLPTPASVNYLIILIGQSLM